MIVRLMSQNPHAYESLTSPDWGQTGKSISRPPPVNSVLPAWPDDAKRVISILGTQAHASRRNAVYHSETEVRRLKNYPY
jgi:hypothetical protein